jgi:hypothetical protein
MTDRVQMIEKAILATAAAYFASHHGTGARAICRERLVQLLSLHAQLDALPNLAAPTDIGGVITAATRVSGQLNKPEVLGYPEFALRTALQRYFAGQSQALAARLGLVDA